MEILITYATKYGSTAEIAQKIDAVLREAGFHPDLIPVKQVTDLAPYTAVILGSAVYIGRWRKEAVQFLERNEKTLAERDVWLFSSGPTGEGDPVELLEGWEFPKGQQAVADRIQPRDITVFHGAVDTDKLNFIERWMSKNVDVPIGDFRDWEAISAWATNIAQALLQPVP